jgi:nicotinamidase-related amidase
MSKTGLLVMDVQNGVVERFAEGSESLLEVLGRATKAARAASVPVIYIRIAFRRGAPEVSRHNRVFSALVTSRPMDIDEDDTQIHPAVAPQDGDVVVVKKRVGSFVGSDLDVVLRSMEIDSLVLTGIATSGVVLTTVREAADLDYELTVLRDGCLDADPEVHRFLMDKLFPRQAEVLETDEWIAKLG